MGVTITSRNYVNRYRPEVVDWLIGNTGDWQNLSLLCEFSVEKKASNQSAFQFDPSNIVTLLDGTEWSKYGFDVGDVVHVYYQGKTINPDGTIFSNWTLNYTRNVVLLQGSEMKLDGADITNVGNGSGQITMLPYQSGQFMVYNAKIWCDKKPQGIEFHYGHISNDDVDSGNLSSFIDGSQTKLICENTDTLTGWQPMEAIGNQSGLAIDSGNWVYLGKTGDNTYRYTLSINFMIASFFEDLNNFENNEAPSVVFDAASLTDNFKVIGYPEWNNPNTRIESKISDTKRLGNTGWFNENFNGLEDNFEISDVQYFDNATGTPTNAISYGSETKVVATIKGVQNIAAGLTKCSYGFSWLTNDEEAYKNNEFPFHKNMRMNTALGVGSGAFVVSSFIDSSTYSGYDPDNGERMDVREIRFSQSGTDIIFEAVFSPTTAFKNFIDAQSEENRKYILWVSIADRTLVTNFTDRVSKLVDYSTMELFVPPLGEYSPMQIDFYEHPQDGGSVSENCSNDMIVEDDILAKIRFKVDISQPIPEAIQFNIESKNSITGEKVEFQKVKVNLTGYANDSAGVPQWNYNDVRGFKLENGNNKNWVKVQREPSLDSGSEYGYVAYFGFKIRWEDWILKNPMPSAFFDLAELNNGFNNDWYHALITAGWEFLFTVYLDVTIDGQIGRYVNEKLFVFKDYFSNAGITAEWKFYRDSDNTLISAGIDPDTGLPLGVLIAGEQVRVETIFTRTSGAWAGLTGVYGVSCLEVYHGSGQFDFRQLSSIWGSEPDNPLIPLVGETKLKLTLISPTELKMECLVEPSLLQDATKFKHSARIGCLFSEQKIFNFTDTELVLDTDNNSYVIVE